PAHSNPSTHWAGGCSTAIPTRPSGATRGLGSWSSPTAASSTSEWPPTTTRCPTSRSSAGESRPAWPSCSSRPGASLRRPNPQLPNPRSVPGKGVPSQRERIRMSHEEVAAFLARQRKVHVATINRDGSPHLMPMYFVLVDGAVAFWTYTKSQKIRNLQRDPRITVMAEEGVAYFDLRGVQVSGRAHLTTDADAVLRFGARL